MNQYMAYRCAFFLCRVLPRAFVYWVGLRLADFYFRIDRAGRDAVISNLRHINKAQGIEATEEHLTGMARKTFQYFGKYLIDFFRYSALTREQVLRHIEIAHPEYLAEALAPGRGVILVTAHIGNWELGGAVMAAMGYAVNAVVLPYRDERLENLFAQCRRRRGIRSIALQNAVRKLLACLKRGELIALLADRDFTDSPEPISFFGKPAYLPRGPARLARHTGAPVLPAFLIRQADDRYLFRLHPPIYPERMKTEMELRDKIRDSLEEEIAANANQWYIFEDFWDLDQHGKEQRPIPRP